MDTGTTCLTSPKRIHLATTSDDAAAKPVLAELEQGLTEYRCHYCNKIHFRAKLEPGSMVKIMCRNKWCRSHKHEVTISVV